MPGTSHSRPVLVGGGQITDRPEDPAAGLEPLALMVEAARRAADDAGGGARLLAAVDTLAVVNVLTHDYGDPAALLAERLGCRPARAFYTAVGGNTPQALVTHLASEIAAGRAELALVVGAEAWRTMQALGRAGRAPQWAVRPAPGPPWGDTRPGISDDEVRHGIARPADSYPMIENAYRAARGLSIAAHRAELGDFGARFARVAAANPYAWFRDAPSAETLMRPTADNRMIAFPYPKRLNAILDVNQGAALLLASEDAARRLALVRDRWVYPWAGVDVTEHWFLQDRRDYHTLPGFQRAATLLLETAGVTLDAIRHLDLYSCFPIAPRLAADMLGLAVDDPRPLTVTGGLPWFGGAGSNYGTHAIATLMERLRADRGSVGLAHTLGWILTKHALGVYSTEPPPHGWRAAGGKDLQAWVDALPRPEVVAAPAGRATIETYTVAHGRDGGPSRGPMIGRLDDGRRFLAVLPADRELLAAMEATEAIGRSGYVHPADGGNVFVPG